MPSQENFKNKVLELVSNLQDKIIYYYTCSSNENSKEKGLKESLDLFCKEADGALYKIKKISDKVGRPGDYESELLPDYDESEQEWVAEQLHHISWISCAFQALVAFNAKKYDKAIELYSKLLPILLDEFSEEKFADEFLVLQTTAMLSNIFYNFGFSLFSYGTSNKNMSDADQTQCLKIARSFFEKASAKYKFLVELCGQHGPENKIISREDYKTALNKTNELIVSLSLSLNDISEWINEKNLKVSPPPAIDTLETHQEIDELFAMRVPDPDKKSEWSVNLAEDELGLDETFKDFMKSVPGDFGQTTIPFEFPLFNAEANKQLSPEIARLKEEISELIKKVQHSQIKLSIQTKFSTLLLEIEKHAAYALSDSLFKESMKEDVKALKTLYLSTKKILNVQDYISDIMLAKSECFQLYKEIRNIDPTFVCEVNFNSDESILWRLTDSQAVQIIKKFADTKEALSDKLSELRQEIKEFSPSAMKL